MSTIFEKNKFENEYLFRHPEDKDKHLLSNYSIKDISMSQYQDAIDKANKLAGTRVSIIENAYGKKGIPVNDNISVVIPVVDFLGSNDLSPFWKVFQQEIKQYK